MIIPLGESGLTNAVNHHWKQKNQRKAVHVRRGVEIGQPMEFSLPA